MGRRFIADMQAGERIEDQIFLIASKDLRTTNQGSLYIHTVLTDRTGQILGRAWQATESMYNALPEGGFIRLKGRVESYRGSLQFIIDAIRPVDSESVDLTEFLPRTKADVNALWVRAREILESIKHPQVKALIHAFINDEALMERFRQAPAASAFHHAYIGGLIEHTCAVLELALATIPRYPQVSLDLVLAGVFLHDLGKTAEFEFDTSIRYTDAGQLLGHIVQGVLWIEDKCKLAEAELGRAIDPDIKLSLQHIIVAHHGKYEFGSPKLPATPEAIAVHYLDNLDAKLHMALTEMENEPDPTARWTNFNRALESRVFRYDVMCIRGAKDKL